MADTPFGSWLARERLVSDGDLREALARQAVYGGTLDTALLESGALTETALWARLSAATGLPVPAPALCDGTGPRAAPVLPADRTRALGAVPVAIDAESATMKVLCRESAPLKAIRVEAARQGFEARLYVVPEVRLLAMRQRVYGERLPARYATLLARLLGPTRARTGFAPEPPFPQPPARRQPPPPPPPPPRAAVAELAFGPPPSEPPAEVAGAEPTTFMPDPPSGPVAGAPTEALCRRAGDREDKGRLLAARALRRRLDQPVVAQLLESLRGKVAEKNGPEEVVVAAIETLGEARDPAAVPLLIERLGQSSAPVIAAAHTALCALCATDLGTSRRRWAAWGRGHLGRPRVEWLLEGLSHKQPELRMAAAEELRQLAGESFGYLFDLPKREREQARKRFVAWWEGVAKTND